VVSCVGWVFHRRARLARSLARDFALGGLLGHTRTTALFDTSPLAALIERIFPVRGIEGAIRRGQLYAVAITATSYHSGRSFTFVQGRPEHPVWVKSRRVVLPVTLTHRHVLASAAIPGIFPPVAVATEAGESVGAGLRLVTPLSPAIRLRTCSRWCALEAGAASLARGEAGAGASADGPPALRSRR
jgi:NTE family protein